MNQATVMGMRRGVAAMRTGIRRFFPIALWSSIGAAAYADTTHFCSILCFSEGNPKPQQSYLLQISDLYFNNTLRNPGFYRKNHLENLFACYFFLGAGQQTHNEETRYFQWQGGKCDYACPGSGRRADGQTILMTVQGNAQHIRAFDIWMHSYAYFDDVPIEKRNLTSWDDLSICALQRELAAKGYTLHADFNMPACLPFLPAKPPRRLPEQRYHPPHMHLLTISNDAGESLRIRVHKDPTHSYWCTSHQRQNSAACDISHHPHDLYFSAQEFYIPVGLLVISGEYSQSR